MSGFNIPTRRVRTGLVPRLLLGLFIALSAAGAHAQERHDRHEAWEHERWEHRDERHPEWEGRHEVNRDVFFDNRFHHGHYYPTVGIGVNVMPPGAIGIDFGRNRFFFHGGVWYRPVGGTFVVIRPPVGIVVPVLPPAYATVWVGRTRYFYANETYYLPANDGYVVVDAPAGAVLEAPPPAPASYGAPAPTPGMWYYCDSARAYYPYVGQCPEPWRAVPANPPR